MDSLAFTISSGIGTGLISGIVASFVFWYSLTHWLVPRIALSPNLARIQSKTSLNGRFYQFKIQNLHFGRPAIDIRLQASIYYPDFPRNGTTNLYSIPLDTVHLMELLPDKEGERRSRRVTLRINDPKFCEIHQSKIFPENIKNSARERTLKLEDLLSICDGAFIRVYVAANDEFSGSRKIFKNEYNLQNLVEGRNFGI